MRKITGRRISRVSKADYDLLKEEGWDEFECTHGYGIFNSYYPTEFGGIVGAHIERIDVAECWDSDEDCAKHAKRYTHYSIIEDIEGIPKVFIDTPNNRKTIVNQIKQKKTSSYFLE